MKLTLQQKTLIYCCLCIGGSQALVFNGIGLFFQPMAETLNVGTGSVAFMVTLITLGTAFFAPLLPKLAEKYKLTRLMRLGAILIIAMDLLLSFITNLWFTYFAGILIGIGSCLFGVIPVSIILRNHFHEKNGSKLGIAYAYAGAVGAVLSLLLGKVISTYDYRMAFRVLAILHLLFSLPATLKVEEGETYIEPVTHTDNGKISKTAFIVLLVISLTYSVVHSMNSLLASSVISFGYTLEFSSRVLFAAMIINTVLQVVFGVLAEKKGIYFTDYLYLAICIFGLAGMILGAKIPWTLFINAGLFTAGMSVSTVGASLLAQSVAKNSFAQVFAKMTIVSFSCSAVMTTVLGVLADMTSSYVPVLLTVIAFEAVTFLLILRLRKETQ